MNAPLTDQDPITRQAFVAKRRGRNIALGVTLGVLAVLFFLITLAKMTART